ncbi:hypothetical protein L6164_016333 [Bauhinia variegata]|uniref:Uncharacterized protein n=1 Tax=Bauhinia variegata TaxID=167791 RepID=A0ACB9NR95_BAUVA|nr:hypothetical protein L6164_016333 [Bauhinia variegata]
MFQPSNQLPVQPRPLGIQQPTTLVTVDLNETSEDSKDNVQTAGFLEAEAIILNSKKLQDDLHMLGMKIKRHEDNLNLLKTQRNKLEESVFNLEVQIGKYHHTSNKPKIENGDNAHLTSEEDINEQIMRHERSAAGIFCQLQTRHAAQASNLTLIKDVVGVVATLGRVEDNKLSMLFSEYLGVETMLGLVCKTFEGVKALEIYDMEGCIDKSAGLHGLGASIGRVLDCPFQVICLEALRPYTGEFVADDPQKRLDILKPRLSNGECPPGFLGFAVNMINVDNSNLFCVTPSGYGLRETLFYNLFSRLQVYRTRAEMMRALPCISDGALSLDGGMIRRNGVFSLGNREDVVVRFPKPSGRSMASDSNIEIEMQMKDMKCKREKFLGDIKREQSLLDLAKSNFNKNKSEFLKYLAESSSYATQVQTAPERFMSR